MREKCINNKGYKGRLTKGKVYELGYCYSEQLDMAGFIHVFCDDNGNPLDISANYFGNTIKE